MNGRRLAILSLLLAPLLWLWPCVFGGRTFVPYDLAQYPPVSLTSTPEQLERARDGANYDVTELPPWFVPELTMARDELRAGRLPTWNPHARGGAPLHAHGLIGLCYPPNWIALFAAEPAQALVFVAWINLALGGLLAFGLLRALGIGTLPAWFGALVFELCGPMAANAFFWMRLGSYVWLPGVLWGVFAAATAQRFGARQLAGVAVPVALTWLAGFPPFAITTSVLGAAFACWLVGRAWREHGAPRARAVALRLCAGCVLGGMLAAPQVLPSLQFFPQSARTTDPTLAEIAHGAFESYGLLGFLVPDAFGHPSAMAETPYTQQNVLALLLTTRSTDGKPALPNFNYTEYALFVGQLALLLALLGAIAGKGRERGFALVAILLGAGLALVVPGVALLYHLPLVKNVAPMRWLAPATLFVAWFAALGLQRLLAAGRALPYTLAGAAAALALALAVLCPLPARWHAQDRTWIVERLAAKYGVTTTGVVDHVQAGAPPGMDRFERAFARLATEGTRAAWWLGGIAAWLLAMALLRDERRRGWLTVGAGAAVAVQLGLHGASVTRGSWLSQPTGTAVHAFLRERAAATATTGGFTIARGSAAPELPAQLPPGQLLVPGLRDLHFYTHYDRRSLQPLRAMLGPVGDQIAAKGYLERSLPTGPPAGTRVFGLFAHPWFDLLGVRYVLSVGSAPLPFAGTPVAIPGAPPGFFVQERATALPRAFAVAAVQAHANDADVIAALLAPDFAPRTVAHALATDLPSPLPPAPAPDGPARTVTFVADDPTRVELDVTAGAEPWLLLTDTFLPGWSATIAGEAAPIVRGDHAFRLLRLPESTCRVVFVYAAPGLTAGVLLAAFATLALAVFAFATVRRSAALPATG